MKSTYDCQWSFDSKSVNEKNDYFIKYKMQRKIKKQTSLCKDHKTDKFFSTVQNIF